MYYPTLGIVQYRRRRRELALQFARNQETELALKRRWDRVMLFRRDWRHSP